MATNKAGARIFRSWLDHAAVYPDRCEIELVIIETDSGSAIVLQWQ